MRGAGESSTAGEKRLVNRVRLGDFVLDVTSGELWPSVNDGGGDSIVLREQPLRVLRLLIESEGRIVTRSEIRKRLWPNDTFVDFGHSINVAIASLRRSLGDTAENPRYIQTLARRGYRLLVSAEPLEWDGAGQTAGAPPPPDVHNLIGKKVSHYRVIEVIGGGGMGMVYRAEDLKLGRSVALKFLPQELAGDAGALRLLQREAQTASALNHPNICTIYEIEEQAGQPFIAMELLDGETVLERLAAQQGPMPLAELVDIGTQVCNGLQAAHDRGIIHRDIKPPNIFLTTQGTVKILDFGVATLVQPDGADDAQSSPLRGGETHLGGPPSSFRSLVAAGTPSYMSPEQVRKEPLDTRSDLFSLGIVLYEMAVGQRPFAGDTQRAVEDAIVATVPPPASQSNPAVPRRLEAILAKALEKDRSRRYLSAADLREDLQALRHGDRRTAPRRWWAAGAAVVCIAAGLAVYAMLPHRAALSTTDTVVMADLANQTGDSVLGVGLSPALRVGLEQTPYLNVLTLDKVAGTLRILGLPPAGPITMDVGLKICRRTNSKMVLGGSVADAGNGFALELEALDCQSGRRVAHVSQEVAARDGIVHVLGASAVRLRRELGEPPSSIAGFNQPLDVATSSSLEAIQHMLQGYQRHIALDLRGAATSYRRAIELDTTFALAYGALAAALESLDPLGAYQAGLKAYELRARLTEPHRLRTEWSYHSAITGDQQQALAVATQWARTYPRDFTARLNLAVTLWLIGQPERAATEAREATRLMPTLQTYHALITYTTSADRLREARAALDQAVTHGFEGQEMHRSRAYLAFLERDTAAMEAEWRWASDRPEVARLLPEQSSIAAYYGQFRRARALADRALQPDLRAAVRPTWLARAALGEAEVGNTEVARRAVASVMKTGSPADARLILALAQARVGAVEPAKVYADSIGRRFPLNTVVQHYYLPTIRAAIELQEGHPARAVELLQQSEPYDLAMPNAFNDLYPVYVRGLAYLQLRDGQRAAGEFRKVLQHPGIMGRTVTGALARLQLARAQVVQGDTAGARTSYQDFLTLWKDADPDVPAYRQARAELTHLSGR